MFISLLIICMGRVMNLPGMFEEACHDAVLLLDEADSFLQDRGGAHASWEVSQVNELLTRMEDFDGLFICSTNRLESLDTASLSALISK